MLARIERTNLILAAVVTCLAGLLWGPRGALGAGAGALLACADFYGLVRLVGRLEQLGRLVAVLQCRAVPGGTGAGGAGEVRGHEPGGWPKL